MGRPARGKAAGALFPGSTLQEGQLFASFTTLSVNVHRAYNESIPYRSTTAQVSDKAPHSRSQDHQTAKHHFGKAPNKNFEGCAA